VSKLYYTAPTDAIFENVKECSAAIWRTLGDEQAYAEEKISRIKDIGNVRDNLMYMVSMFDQNNQEMLSQMICDDARAAIRERLIDGGANKETINF